MFGHRTSGGGTASSSLVGVASAKMSAVTSSTALLIAPSTLTAHVASHIDLARLCQDLEPHFAGGSIDVVELIDALTVATSSVGLGSLATLRRNKLYSRTCDRRTRCSQASPRQLPSPHRDFRLREEPGSLRYGRQPKRSNLLVLLSQKAAGDKLIESNSGGDSQPAWGLRWTLLMTVDRGLTCMSRGLRV